VYSKIIRIPVSAEFSLVCFSPNLLFFRGNTLRAHTNSMYRFADALSYREEYAQIVNHRHFLIEI
jgi:hypothetical protein